jgi:taurine dioxygenase
LQQCTTYRHLQLSPLAGALGAEVQGLDVARPLAPEVVGEIRRALLAHLVIFFPRQQLGPAELLAFAEQFGQPTEYPQMKGLPGYAHVIAVTKLEQEKVNFGGVWHSDTSYLERPPMGTMLYAVEVPPYGGDTLFANQYLAYETLSDGLKKTLKGLLGVNTSAKAEMARTREERLREEGAVLKVLVGTHAVVRTHAETGRQALYMNAAHTTHFQGWTIQESQPLLDYLFAHQVRPEFTCRFRWQPGSLAFWDNRCTQHNPINDYDGFRRVMHRVTLAGEAPQ